MNWNYYKDKVVWITGASSGIGAAMAQALSKKTTTLILSARNSTKLKEVREQCDPSATIHIIELDLSEHDQLSDIFKIHKSLLSQVDIMIHNGGISQRSLVEETNFSVLKKLMDVNYLGTSKLTLLLLPYFIKKSSGHFVVISSIAGKVGVPLRSGYSASKFALHGFFDALRAEQVDNNIDVTMICPGYIHTDISKHAMTGDGKKQGTMDSAQLNGMHVDTFVGKALSAISEKKAEVYIGGFKETKLAVFVDKMFPALFRKIIARSKVT